LSKKQGLTDEEKADIESLENRLEPEEREILKRIGQVVDLNTESDPVTGGMDGVGVGFQRFLSIERDRFKGETVGSRVVFESGSTPPEGAHQARWPGDRGYVYTFEAERVY
jgi:hypothetical protein